MPKYIVRVNCEYSIEVEAHDHEQAQAKASAIDVVDWDMKAWSDIEVEEVGDDD